MQLALSEQIGPMAHRHPTKVTAFHKIVLDVTSRGADLLTVLCEQFDLVPDRPLQGADWDHLKAAFAESSSGDMDSARCSRFTQRVFEVLQRPARPHTTEELVRRIEQVYGQIDAGLSDLLISFVHWTLVTSRRCGASEVVFLARDATPLFVIALGLEARGIRCGRLSLLDLNRAMMTDSDSDDPVLSFSRRSPVDVYLGSKLSGSERLAVVDTGVYGTLIKATLEMRLFQDPVVLFFASKNPSLLGYLNLLTAGPGDRNVPELNEFGEKLCDTVETWPKLYTSSELRVDPRGPTAVGRLSDLVSAAAGLVIYRTLAQRCQEVDISALDPRSAAHRLSRFSAEDDAPLTLAEPLPRWAHADAWRASWQLGPISPLGECFDAP